MRAVWLFGVALVGACSFHPNGATGEPPKDGPGEGEHDAPPSEQHDAREIDAPPFQCGAAYDFQDPVSGVHYRLTEAKTWPDAEADCESDGGRLAKIETADEDSFLTDNTPTQGFFWIGLYDKTATDTYVWSDDSSLGSYSNFTDGDAPVSSIHDCVDKSGQDGTWDAWYCDPAATGNVLQKGICECHDG